jgi:hypothetical protein
MNTMSTSTLLALITVVIVVVVAVGLIVKTQRSKRLKTRFGPEYHRAVEEAGSATQAESRLEKLERRVASSRQRIARISWRPGKRFRRVLLTIPAAR